MRKNWVSIIIANYNGEEYLKTCLSSVFKSTYEKYVVIVVDDSSRDKSIEILHSFKKNHRNLKIIRNKKNLGPSASRNKALRLVNTEYVYFLDNDTRVKPQFLTHCMNVFKTAPYAGAVQSVLTYFDAPDTIQNAGLKLIRQTGWAIGLMEGKSLKELSPEPQEIIGLSAALCVKTAVFEKVHFDPAFFHYSEDLDFSWRIWIAGYRIYTAPKSVVYHRVKKVDERANVGANQEIIYFHLAKNSLLSLTKNYQLLNLCIYLPMCVLVLLARALLALVVRKDPTSLIATLKAIGWYTVHLADTLQAREHVQRNRVSPDSSFINKVMLPDNLIDVYRKYFKQTGLLPIT